MAFRMTPNEAEWLDEVAEESGMTKQDFIISRLRDEAITVMPNVRVQRALRMHMQRLCAELSRMSSSEPVDERIAVAAERLSRLCCELGGAGGPAIAARGDADLFGMER